MAKKVALSYGHGEDTFRETGSKGVIVDGNRYAEHTHNYQEGIRLKKILDSHGIQTMEVQPANGRDVPLVTRTNKANDWGADLYWSIHANAAGKDARGWCAFYWGTSPEGKQLAQLYAKYVKALGLPLYSNGVYPSARGTWSDFHELRETAMIAILTENGFMTNSQDFEYIFKNKDDYYNKMAQAHAKAILEYFEIKYDPVKAGEVKKSVVKTTANLPTKVDTMPPKRKDMYRLAKLIDTTDPLLIERLRQEGYRVIELPK